MKTLAGLMVFVLANGVAPAQMEIRGHFGYGPDAYRRAHPAVGSKVVTSSFVDLDGKTWELDKLKGTITVVIGGGYT